MMTKPSSARRSIYLLLTADFEREVAAKEEVDPSPIVDVQVDLVDAFANHFQSGDPEPTKASDVDEVP